MAASAPALYDRREAGHGAPPDLISAWQSGSRTDERASQLLAPFKLSGTVAASDSAGLSRLSAARGPLEVLAALTEMKASVHSLGLSYGSVPLDGAAWEADNTVLFYPRTVPVVDAVRAALEAHARRAGGISIGVCIHCGDFFSIGGVLYGGDAETVSHLAEECTSGGETLVTRAALDAMDPGGRDSFAFAKREDLVPKVFEVYTVTPRTPVDSIGVSSPVVADREEAGAEEHYPPVPFSHSVYEQLGTLQRAPATSRQALLESLSRGYAHPCTVVMVEFRLRATGRPSQILDTLVLQAAAADLVAHATASVPGCTVVENASGAALLLAPSIPAALSLSRTLTALHTSFGPPSIGIAQGDILVLPSRAPGGTVVSGGAVNLASKLAGELGTPGSVRILAGPGVGEVAGGMPFEETVSGVVLRGWIVAGTKARFF
ncbi:hypothetical protein DFJ74DRAFT_663321 [Hyaloraphidium curvatum]|nr:hypothetical protein DFJ74DRAFT_663321 [Hyaloraphidium curvatum]